MNTKQQIKAAKSAPILEVVKYYFSLKERGNGYVALCPFHCESTPSFSVNPAMNIFKCFGCNVGGDAITFVMKYENKTFLEAVQMIMAIRGSGSEKTAKTQRTLPKKVNPQFKAIPYDTIPLAFLEVNVQEVYANSLTKQLADIFGETVVKEVVEDYRLLLEPNGYIHFPQIDKSGKYRTGKSIQYKNGHRTGATPRWAHNTFKDRLGPDFKHKQCFTGEHLLASSANNRVAIVEGQSTMIFMAALSRAARHYQIESLQYFSSFTWLCTGGVDGVGWKNRQVYTVLAGKQVMLFPDAGFYDNWLADAELMQESGIKVQMSYLVENKYKHGEIEYNKDLRDYFMESADQIRVLINQHKLATIG